jgi:hypothetical protein
MSIMKNLRTVVLCTCITVCSLYSAAQTPKVNEPDLNKPHLFDNLPAMIPVSMASLNDLLQSKPGVSIHTTFSNDVTTSSFEGKVVSSVSKYDDKVQTVLIKSTNYNGASLYISRVTTDDGKIKYNGRLISLRHGDVFVLQQKESGFVLVKKNFYDVVNE